MSTYYEFKGSLTFANEEIAKQAFEYLICNEKTYFFVPLVYRKDPKFTTELKLEGNVLIINDANYGSDLIYSTADAIRHVIGLSISGKVIFQDGEEGDGRVDRYYLSASIT